MGFIVAVMRNPAQLPPDFHSLPFCREHRLERDWFGVHPAQQVDVIFAADSNYLWFAGKGSGTFQYDLNLKSGDFTPGLWEQDLIELFISNRTSGHYVEVNLSPAGARWAATFSAPRKKIADWDPTICGTYSENSEATWNAAIWMALDELREQLDGEPTHFNMTAIVNTPDQQFLSLSDLPGKDPDFHQPSHFTPITLS